MLSSRLFTLGMFGSVVLFGALLAPQPAASAPLPELVVDAVILGDPPTLSPGEIFSYAMVVTNDGASMDAGSESRSAAQLPPKIIFDFAEEGARGKMPFFLGVTCTFSDPVVTCVGPPLVAGDHYVVRIQAQVDPAAQGGNALMHAVVDPLASVVEASESNNNDKVKVRIQ